MEMRNAHVNTETYDAVMQEALHTASIDRWHGKKDSSADAADRIEPIPYSTASCNRSVFFFFSF